MKQLFCLLAFILSINLFAHGDEDHPAKEDKTETINPNMDSINQEINEAYLKNVKPIFKNKCLDCHGSGNELPWYYSIPGPKQLIDHDIKDAKKHMDMSNDWPFTGHKVKTGKKHLNELKETLEENEMPPFLYKLIHRDSAPTQEEIKIINEWISTSLEKLK